MLRHPIGRADRTDHQWLLLCLVAESGWARGGVVL